VYWGPNFGTSSAVNDRKCHDRKLLFGSLTSFVPIN